MGEVVAESVHGDVADRDVQPGEQGLRALGRDRVPGGEKRIVDTFLCVQGISENVAGQSEELSSVFVPHFFHGLLGPCKEQVQYFPVCHAASPSCKRPSMEAVELHSSCRRQGECTGSTAFCTEKAVSVNAFYQGYV